VRKKILAVIAAAAVLFFVGKYIYDYFESPLQSGVMTLYGNVDVRQVDISFQVGGRVEQIHFEEGDKVLPGQLMGVLDKRPFQDKVREAEANVASIANNLENAERVYTRRKALIGNGSVSVEDLQNSEANRNILLANLQQAEASLALAQTDLEYTEVYAPSEGIILTRIREPGSVVNISEPIYTVSLISPVWVRAYVAEPELGLVEFGMKAEIHTDTPDGKIYTGRVGFISPVAEFTPKTVETTQLRTDLVYRLRVYADNPDEGLKQGMPVTVKLYLPENDDG